MIRILAAIAILIATACGLRPQESNTRAKSATAPAPIAFCKVAKEMTWAADDSIDTQAEIRAYNAIWKKHCRPEGSANGKH